ncbi:MAG TPA: hypothetical protein VGI93_10895 [Steroidobacteraceae bacterium]|jgi:hypothetical protein
MSDGVPQFSTAEYAKAGEVPCRVCGKTVSGAYYRVNGQTACASCAKTLQGKFPQDSHAAFVRGLLFGIGGAIAGLTLYVVFALVTHLVMGIISLAVGFIVGKALVFGSGGVRGRRYQIAAVILTYLAVSMSSVPIAISMGVHPDVGKLIILGILSPLLDFHDPVHGIIGLVILVVGLRIAWRLTAGPQLEVEGPLTQAPSAEARI